MDTVIGPVPVNWTHARLSDLCTITAGPSGEAVRHRDRTIEGVPVVTPRNIKHNRIVAEDLSFVDPQTADSLARYRLAAGDVVCARAGNPGDFALIQKDQSGWIFGTTCLRLRPADTALARYLIQYLGHPNVRDWISRRSVGSVIRSLSTTTISELPVVLPPAELRSAIVDILDALDEKARVHYEIAESTAALRTALLPLLLNGLVTNPRELHGSE